MQNPLSSQLTFCDTLSAAGYGQTRVPALWLDRIQLALTLDGILTQPDWSKAQTY